MDKVELLLLALIGVVLLIACISQIQGGQSTGADGMQSTASGSGSSRQQGGGSSGDMFGLMRGLGGR